MRLLEMEEMHMMNDKRKMFVKLARRSLGLPSDASSCCAAEDHCCSADEQNERSERRGGTHETEGAEVTSLVAAH
jgi:hypothetical protein